MRVVVYSKSGFSKTMENVTKWNCNSNKLFIEWTGLRGDKAMSFLPLDNVFAYDVFESTTLETKHCSCCDYENID